MQIDYNEEKKLKEARLKNDEEIAEKKTFSLNYNYWEIGEDLRQEIIEECRTN